MSDRRLNGLNPPDRRPRRRDTAPPPTDPQASMEEASQTPAPSQQLRAVAPADPAAPSKPTKAGKVMHSVPGDALSALRRVALRTGRTNTDIVLECLVRHSASIQAEQADTAQLSALERRVRTRRRRDRQRASQLTLYLTPDERHEVDTIAQAAGMNRSRLVTEALDRGLGDIE